MPFPLDPSAPGGPTRAEYLRSGYAASVATADPAAPAARAASVLSLPRASIRSARSTDETSPLWTTASAAAIRASLYS